MTELSVIIPYVNEWPQIAFTIRSIAEELDGIDFEIIAVDNLHPMVELQQGFIADRGHDRYIHAKQNYGFYKDHPENSELHGSAIKAQATLNPWLKYMRYDKKLSHWNARRIGAEAAEGSILCFIDAHCVPARDTLKLMFVYYLQKQDELDGSIHLPLTYHILEPRKLIYKPVINLEVGELHYTFTTYRDSHEPYEVPCMSSCGLMISKALYEWVGGWPKYLGIYGGGENFMNYALTVTGKKKWIFPGGPLHHHGDKRGYNFSGYDTVANRLLANYLTCGKDMAWRMAKTSKYRPLEKILTAIFEDKENQRHRQLIKERTVVDIGEWVKKWTKSN